MSSKSANYSVTVSKKTSYISIANIAIEKGNTFKIAATTTPKDAPLTYTILNGESVISIEGNDITALAAGEATVRAYYAGSSEYNEAIEIPNGENTLTVKVIDQNGQVVETSGTYIGTKDTEKPKIVVDRRSLICSSSSSTQFSLSKSSSRLSMNLLVACLSFLGFFNLSNMVRYPPDWHQAY